MYFLLNSFLFVWSKQVRILGINDENTKIQALIKGYSYDSNKLFDRDIEYDEEIKESILEYKRQRDSVKSFMENE